MEKQYESDEIEIDLKDLFFEVVTEWKKIVISTVLAAVIMYVVSAFIMTPQYQSTSKLYLIKSSGLAASLADLQLSTNLATDYMEIIDGRPILDQVIKNLSLEMTYGELKGLLVFNNPTGSRIIEITVTHPEPQTAKAIADEIADVAATYIEEKMDQDKPSVLQYGYVADDPVSPNVMKNAVLGALVGAFLAIAIIVITYLMNDTVMTPDDMERKVGVKVLASLPFDEEEDDGIPAQKQKKSFGESLKEFFKDDDDEEDERIISKLNKPNKNDKSNKNNKNNKRTK